MKKLSKIIISLTLFLLAAGVVAIVLLKPFSGSAMKGSESPGERFLKEESFWERYGVSPEGLVLWLDPVRNLSFGLVTKPNICVNKRFLVNFGLWISNGVDQSDLRSYGDASNWYDLSGKGNHGTQATAANQPTITPAAGLADYARNFDGSNDYKL